MTSTRESAPLESNLRSLGLIGAVWGVLGIFLFVGSAVVRLTPTAYAAWQYDWTIVHWVATVASLIFIGVVEGYRGFQKQFSPRGVARAQVVARQPTLLRVLLAPAFCMGFFDATKKRLIVSWVLTAGIVVLVLIVRQLPQPWRGIVDVGVVFGLTWGLIAMLVFAVMAIGGRTMPVPSDVPGEPA